MSVLKVTSAVGALAFTAGSALTNAGASALPATTDIDLDFEQSATVTEVLVDVGEQVEEGEALARVERAQAAEDLASAEANLATAQARLAELLEGRSSAEAEQDQIAADRARAALAEANADSSSTATAQEVSAALRAEELEQAERARRDARDTASANEMARTTAFAHAEAQLRVNEESARLAQERVATAQAAYDAARAELADAEAAYEDAGCAANPDDPECVELAAQVDAEQRAADEASATLDGARDGARQAQDQVRLATESLTRARNDLASGRLADRQAVDRADDALATLRLQHAAAAVDEDGHARAAAAGTVNAELDQRAAEASAALAAEPPTDDQVAEARAAVVHAESAVAAARRALARTTLRAPADGVVTAIRSDVGEVAGSGAGGQEGESSAFLTLEVVVE